MPLIPIGLLATVFETFAPMSRAEAMRRANLAIETLDATQSRTDRLGLGIALRLLELPPLNALAGAGLTRFTRASQTGRERVLRSWAISWLPQQRTVFQALKRLALFLAYADPGPDPGKPANPTWERIGYRPPTPPAEPAPSSVVPLAVDRTRRDPLRLDADVVIVGSGAGGSVVAARLAAAGLAALVLESGRAILEPAIPTLEGDAWRDLFLDRGTTSTEDRSITILAGATLGGGTTINWTTALAPPDELRRRWELEHGLTGLAGPETDADVARLSNELDLQAPSVVPPKDRLVIDGARTLGWDGDVTRRNAGPCTECGGCMFGCARGSKRTAVRIHLAAAAAAGARILSEARVARLHHGAGGVRGVSGRLGPTGRPFIVRAGQVVVAAGALRTPLLLEASGIRHPQLGRNLRLHPTVAIIAVMPEPVEMWLGPPQASRSLEFIRPGAPAADGLGPAHGGFLIEPAPPHPGLAAASTEWFGRDDSDAILAQMRYWAPLIAIINETGSGRVRTGPGGRARISYRLNRADGDTARRALVELARLCRAGGAFELRAGSMPSRRWATGEPFEAYLRGLARLDTAPNRLSLFSAHQMGTVRAGADPHAHAADPAGRVRLDGSGSVLRGAYVADASLFPTAAGVNPMLTVMALAERVARAVLADRG
jgi:choline dehydrogenase-like flavoprotein